MESSYHFREHSRRVIECLARVVCPPQMLTAGLLEPLVDSVESYFAALPAHIRRLLLVFLAVFDDAAVFFPAARVRRFVKLDDAAAEQYFLRFSQLPWATGRNLLRLTKGVINLHYYELPVVKQSMGYSPDDYIADTSRRRLKAYGPEIRKVEAAVVLGRSKPGLP